MGDSRLIQHNAVHHKCMRCPKTFFPPLVINSWQPLENTIVFCPNWMFCSTYLWPLTLLSQELGETWWPFSPAGSPLIFISTVLLARSLKRPRAATTPAGRSSVQVCFSFILVAPGWWSLTDIFIIQCLITLTLACILTLLNFLSLMCIHLCLLWFCYSSWYLSFVLLFVPTGSGQWLCYLCSGACLRHLWCAILCKVSVLKVQCVILGDF